MSRAGTFTPNLKLPVHRWFRYSAGFSAGWVEAELQRARPRRVLDPFAGSATTLVACQRAGLPSEGWEAHPLVVRIGRAKLDWVGDPVPFERVAARLAEAPPAGTTTGAPDLLRRMYTADSLAALMGMRAAADELLDLESAAGRLAWLALLAILRPCATGGTAPWQYVLPKRSKARVPSPQQALRAQVAMMVEDMAGRPEEPGAASLLARDARSSEDLEPTADLMLTSPPYPNNYDYADATRLEQTFLGEVERWADLHQATRRHLVRACSQHMRRGEAPLDSLLAEASLEPVLGELEPVVHQLAALREERAGRKAYDRMVAAYFVDMAAVLGALARATRSGAELVFVLGDSAPYGVHVPAPRWLARLGQAAGLESEGFETLRRRNVKWKNRKHRVPLLEGVLRLRKG